MGHGGAKFELLKFRTMRPHDGAADTGVSGGHKSARISRFSAVIRAFRVDEIPQLWNVLRGDMSLVGPRPERQYYIDQIKKEAPHYRLLHKVKPGITSWGQVKYGYAENVEQMVERMRFDLLYIDNMSIAMDIKILIYTVLIVIQGRGK